RVRKPVVFFHAPQVMAVEMRVQFPGGVPLVWWPTTETPSITDNGLGSVPKNDKPATELTWKLHLQKAPDQFRKATGPNEDAGATQEVELKDAAEPRWPEKAAQTLQDQLKDAGLNEDEAKSLVVVWTREFFQTDGVTMFYRLPQEEYERLLPLTLKPVPEKL